MVDCRFRMLVGEPEFMRGQSMYDSNTRRLRKAEPDPERSVRRTMLTIHGQANPSTPCAACKLLRRRCALECPFAAYFSPHEPQKFACVHKVFGASNVSKMLLDVPEEQRADAASSLVYEASARLRDPVYGCMGAISTLQQQAQSLQAELSAVRQEIHDIHVQRQRAENAMSNAMGAGMLGFSTQTERMSSGNLSMQTVTSDYGVGPISNGVPTDTKDHRIWAI